MLGLTHKRSEKAHVRREEKYIDYESDKTERQLIGDIFLDYSLQDYFNGEIVFEKQTCDTIFKKVEEAFGECPDYIYSLHQHGTVLNRFELRPFPFPKIVYYGRSKRSFQR